MNNFNKEFYTVKEVLGYLKIKQELLSEFIAKGWIKTYTHPKLKFKVFFDIKEIESFKRRYNRHVYPSKYEFAHPPEEDILLFIQQIENKAGVKCERLAFECCIIDNLIYMQNPKQI